MKRCACYDKRVYFRVLYSCTTHIFTKENFQWFSEKVNEFIYETAQFALYR